MFQGSDPRMNASSAEQIWGQKMRYDIKSNVPNGSTNEDKYLEGTRQREAMKYLRESCYDRIKCSVTNSLAVLMRKWYLNSNFQLYSYSRRLQEGVDRISINTSNLNLHMEGGMRRRRRYKRERNPWGMGIKK